MKSFLHCFWTGPTFPQALRKFIKAWVPYLRRSNSNFELILWTTEDSFEAAREYLSKGLGNSIDLDSPGKCFAPLSLIFTPAKVNFSTFYIGKLESILLQKKFIWREIIELFRTHKYYTSISNLARILIVNHCSGIYTDIDYLYPNPKQNFPKNMAEITQVFKWSGQPEFYMPVIGTEGIIAIENQCLVLTENSIGELNHLIRNIELDLAWTLDDIKKSGRLNTEFLEDEITKNLSTSFFYSGTQKELLEAYKQRDATLFCRINKKLYAGKTHPHSKSLQPSYFNTCSSIGMVDESGTRHLHYKPISEITFIGVAMYFGDTRRRFSNRESKECWNKFRKYFSEEHMDHQFRFKTEKGNTYGMYTWANPGYSRLAQLEEAVHTVEKYYVPRSRRGIPLSLIKKFIVECRTLSLKNQRKEAEEATQELIEMLKIIKTNFHEEVISSEIACIMVKECFAIVHKLQNINEILERINSDMYLRLKNLIDSEKSPLTVDDIEGFIRT